MRKEKEAATKLRSQGKTYTEIQQILGKKIPTSTLSHWCKNISLPEESIRRIKDLSQLNLAMGRLRSLENQKIYKRKRDQLFESGNQKLLRTYQINNEARKIALTILYLAEGHKNHSTVVFGNSDPEIIKMFLSLLRNLFKTDESKFRATVQCRADQDSNQLKLFWSGITKIPLEQFYKTQVDQRTVGKITKKPNYKGVCRIDYFSALVDQELKYIARMLQSG